MLALITPGCLPHRPERMLETRYSAETQETEVSTDVPTAVGGELGRNAIDSGLSSLEGCLPALGLLFFKRQMKKILTRILEMSLPRN